MIDEHFYSCKIFIANLQVDKGLNDSLKNRKNQHMCNNFSDQGIFKFLDDEFVNL